MIDLWTEAVYRTTKLQFSVKGIPQSLEELKSALWVKVDDEPTQDESKFDFTFDQIVAKKQELETLVPLEQLRRKRDKLIAETDWWVMPDRTATQAQLDYRQALRDITNTYSSLDDVVWPEKPE